MLLKIEGIDETIDTEKLTQELGVGKDGVVKRLNNDEVIKIINPESQYMTEEKIKDLRGSVPEGARLVVPKRICRNLYDYDKEIIKGIKIKSHPAVAYTSRYIREYPNAILSMKTDDYLEQMALLRLQVEEFFTRNEISIGDVNPANILSTMINDQTMLYLIDHDRCVTKSSMYSEKEPLKGKYANVNERNFALIMYRVLLLQIRRFNGFEESRKIDKYISDECRKIDLSFDTTVQALKGKRLVKEYVGEITESIKKHR